jgi:HD-GYP domain-containing protein (c-di-GMP phosphodiesterase class II)
VDVYDALTTTRAYRPAMSHDRALAEMSSMRNAWSARVFEAFHKAVGEPQAQAGRKRSTAAAA